MPKKPHKIGGAGEGFAAGMAIDLTPFMNVIIVLIPMLLMSAEFAKTSILDISLPASRGSNVETKQTEESPEQDKSNKMLLTLIVTDSVVTIGAKGGFLPSIFYREYHHYISKEQQKDTTIIFNPRDPKPPVNSATGQPFTINERYDIWLYAVDENTDQIIQTLYTKTGEMLTDEQGFPIQSCKIGDKVYALSNPRREITVKDPADFTLKKLSAYDELQNRLMKIKERFFDVEDKDDIIIAAENQVMYDKIIQLMDIARVANYPNISIAKLRA